jgi:hypothetical protein
VCEQDRNTWSAVSNRWRARESIASRDDLWHSIHRTAQWRDFFKVMDVPNPNRSKESTSMKHSSIKRAAILFGVATLVACGSDSTAPTTTVLGTYVATEFTTTGSSGQTNQLIAGSTLSMILSANGSVAGHLHLAATNGNPASDADMAGTWTQTGSTVTFSQSADTFVRNMTFNVVASGNHWQLVGDQVFSGTEIKITLNQTATV